MMQKEKMNVDVFEGIRLMNLKGVAFISLKYISREKNDPYFERRDILSFVPCYQRSAQTSLETLE